MVKYYFDKDSYIIEDYLNASKFASFLPAVSGVKGKPLWAFYTNRGQGMGGFGVSSKETPITPFDSANLCYQNIELKSFRTFLKIDNQYFEAFKDKSNFTKMTINKSNFVIEEHTLNYSFKVTYSIVPNQDYAGLIRKVEITNNSNQEKEFVICDGLPIFFPHGLSNYCYKELVSLMAAYCQVHGLEKRMPFVKFKTSTGDCSVVSEVKDGNAFVSFDENNQKLFPIVDLENIFSNDDSLISPEGFIHNSFDTLIKQEQQTENKLPCAFSLMKKRLKAKEATTIYSLYGYFSSQDLFEKNLDKIEIKTFDKYIIESEKLIDQLLSPLTIHTANHIFDLYAKQSLLDNNLRGGFPINLTKNSTNPYYVFSRKHGDMERDYNAFLIPSTYYSSGPGNFRDVLQNRRCDLYLYPFVKDYNIKLFFSLIQLDGQNPLNVAPNTFSLDENYQSELIDSKFLTKLKLDYSPGELYEYLKDDNLANIDTIFEDIISHSTQHLNANFAEGYWVDHWTYLLDLLENYVSIYPDKVHDLLFDDSYKYFYSLVYVEPRSEKYCFIDKDHIRQYGAVNLKKLKEECEKYNLDIKKTYYLKDKENKEIKTSLISKIINLIIIKFTCLDNQQMGIEMECEKPGWNDAMNGLPGMFASSMSESVELLRLIKFIRSLAPILIYDEIPMLREQITLFKEVNTAIKDFLDLYSPKIPNFKKITSFQFWNSLTTAREKFREETHYNVCGDIFYMPFKEMMFFIDISIEILENGIKKAKSLFDGILPSYLVYNVEKYELTDHINYLGYQTIKVKEFKLVKLPLFLEASARSLKLGKEFADKEQYEKIKQTNIYDKKLKFYKTSEDLDDAPFEIGRVHAFTKGWLERECNFLHMTYKYLLGLLKCGLYKEFYEEIKTNFVINMDPYVYGRSIIEHSSFIVPTCNPNKNIWGKGYFARLTGANAECLDMIFYMFLSKNVFAYKYNELYFVARPLLAKEFFLNHQASITFLNNLTFKIINETDINAYEATSFVYEIDNVKYDVIKGKLAEDIRDGNIKEVICYIK